MVDRLGSTNGVLEPNDLPNFPYGYHIRPLVAVPASAVYSPSRLLPVPFRDLGLYAIAGALFFPNLLLWSEVGYFDAAAETKPLPHLWSLGVEEQFRPSLLASWPGNIYTVRRQNCAFSRAASAGSFARPQHE